MLDTCHLIAGCAIVLGEFCFNDDLRIEFIWHDKVRSLIKARDLLSAFGFAGADPCLCQGVFNGQFEDITHEFGNRISMSGERPTQEPLIKKHGIWNTYSCQATNRSSTLSCISFVQTMNLVRIRCRSWRIEQHTGRIYKRFKPLCRSGTEPERGERRHANISV